ncbi:MAG: hypothetical protein HYV60_02410 [Planctomycetia bacterium]|nr:hypothetical protein [Planctomycetia bacterium]
MRGDSEFRRGKDGVGNDQIEFEPQSVGMKSDELVIANTSSTVAKQLPIKLTGAAVGKQRILFPKSSFTSVVEAIVDANPPELQVYNFISLFPVDGPDAGNKRSDEGGTPRLRKAWRCRCLVH